MRPELAGAPLPGVGAAPSQIGLSISVSGMLYTFGCLVPPAQTTVGLLCLALALAWLYRRGRRVWSTA